MELLTPALQNYPWGSKTLLAQLRGFEEPSSRPEAELWFGAHHAAPAMVAGTALDALIAADPDSTLGPRVRTRFGDELPFLLKILAVDTPLSVQAHPTRSQAEAGFAAENAAGIGLSDHKRNYKDPNHKPELLVALTAFRALAGLRPVADTIALFDAINCPVLARYGAMLQSDNEEEGVRALFTTWISLPRAKRVELIDATVHCCGTHLDQHTDAESCEEWMVPVMRCVLELNDLYPGDVGVLAALLLNYVELAPGDALFLGAGRLHAYLSGLGVEIMANSDNVLRGGLTPKHVDVPQLVRILDFSTLADPRIDVDRTGDVTQYAVPIDDFVLSRYRLSPGGTEGAHEFIVDTDGPAIVLCTAGRACCGGIQFGPGEAVWVPACEDPCVVRAFEQPLKDEGATEVFYARV